MVGCKLIPDYPDATGILPMLYSIRDCIPMAFPTLILVIFFILFAGQYYLIKGKTGRAKVLIALNSSSFVTVVLSMFLTLSMLVTYKMLLFWVFVSMVSFIALVVSDKQ